MKFSKC